MIQSGICPEIIGGCSRSARCYSVLVRVLLLTSACSHALVSNSTIALVFAVSAALAVVTVSRMFPDREKIFSILLGCGIPLLSYGGSGPLIVYAALALCFFPSIRMRYLSSGGIWILILSVYAAALIFASFDLSLLASTPLAIVREGLSQAPPIALHNVLTLTRWFVAFQVFRFFCDRPMLLTVAISGLIVSLSLCALIGLVCALMGIYSFQAVQVAYWGALRRYASTCTDPNAWGILAFLSIGFIGLRSRGLSPRLAQLLIIFSVIVAAALSGSRTLLLGIALVFASLVTQSARRVVYGVIAGTIFLSILTVIPLESIDAARTFIPESVHRVLKTFHPDHAFESLWSRLTFTRIGLEMWKHHPLFGVGLGEYTTLLPLYAALLSIDLAGWVDNSNNFYVGVLAEMGVVGLIAYLSYAITYWPRWSSQAPYAKRAVLVFYLLLFLGPHLSFDETAIAFSLLLAAANQNIQAYRADAPTERSFGRACLRAFNTLRAIMEGVLGRRLSLLILCALLITAGYGAFQQSATAPYGFSAESIDGASPYRWLSRRSRFSITCGTDNQATLKLRSIHPDISQKPVQIQIASNYEHTSVAVQSTQLQTIPLRCTYPSALRIAVEVDRAFIPALTHKNGDFRALALQLFTPLVYDTGHDGPRI